MRLWVAFFQSFSFLASLKGNLPLFWTKASYIPDKSLLVRQLTVINPASLAGSLPSVSGSRQGGQHQGGATLAVVMTFQSFLGPLVWREIITPSSESPTGVVSGMCIFLDRIPTRRVSISLLYTERPPKRTLSAVRGAKPSPQPEVAGGVDEEAIPRSPSKSCADSNQVSFSHYTNISG